jgi:hypothetical protein
LKQFAKTMGQPNCSAFNKWKKVWVAAFLVERRRSIVQGQTRSHQVSDGPLYRGLAVADFFPTFETRLLLVNFSNSEWIIMQWA